MNQFDEEAMIFEKVDDFVLLKLIFGFYLITVPQVCWKRFVLSRSFYLDFENRLFVILRERPLGVMLDETTHFKFMRDFDDFNRFYEPNDTLSFLLYYLTYLFPTWKDFELWIFSWVDEWFYIFCICFSDIVGLFFCILSYFASNTSHYFMKILVL